MKLSRSEPLTFSRADGTIILAQPCTRGRMGELLELERKPAKDLAKRRGKQVAIFLQDAQWLQADEVTPAGNLSELLASLDVAEEIDIINALTMQHHGYKAEDAVELQQIMREVALKKKAPTTLPSS